jgi:hypothetical protein
VHNIKGQVGAARASYSGCGQPFDDQKAGQVAHELFDTFIVAKGWNIWSIRSVTLECASSLPDEKGVWHLKVLLGVHTADQKSFLLLDYDYLGTDRYGFVDFKLTGLHGADYLPFLEFAIRGFMDPLEYREKGETGAQQAALRPPTAEQALPMGLERLAGPNARAPGECHRVPSSDGDHCDNRRLLRPPRSARVVNREYRRDTSRRQASRVTGAFSNSQPALERVSDSRLDFQTKRPAVS